MSAEPHQVIELPSQFVQVQLNGLKSIVDNHRQDNQLVKFDASEVERVDGAAVQFLLAVSQLQLQMQGAMVVNANEVMLNAFNDMGVVDLIKTDSVANPPVGAA